MIELLRPFIISFFIGFIIGIERERSHPIGEKAIGMRTFVLFSLAGTLAAYMNDTWIAFSVSLAVFTLIIVSYIRSTAKTNKVLDIGITTEISAVLVYCLGYLSLKSEALAVSIAVITLAILFARKQLHKFARDKISHTELQAAIVILLMALAVLSFLPNKTIDPWHLVNPERLGIILLALACIQFVGYLAIRIFGEHLGMLLMGFFGGLISSTSVFLTLPNIYKKNKNALVSVTTAAVYATLATLFEVLVILFLAAPSLLPHMLWPIISMMVIGGSVALLLLLDRNHRHIFKEISNPLDILAILRLTAVIAAMLILATLAKNTVGTQGLQVFALLGGLIEMQSTTLAISTLFATGKLTMNEAYNLLGIVILASFISKFGILWVEARDRFALITSLYLGAMIVVGVIVSLLLRG